MSARYCLGPVGQIPPGEGRNFEVGGKRIAVFRGRDGRAYATQAACPRRAGPLADGLLGGQTLVCPLHDWRFNLITGEPVSGGCSIEVYPIRLGGDGLLEVEL